MAVTGMAWRDVSWPGLAALGGSGGHGAASGGGRGSDRQGEAGRGAASYVKAVEKRCGWAGHGGQV